ncbi:TPA: type VI secretion system baseplate subunit TssG [Escherichia coli]|nr:type VI secretion system baseplate subunit TssG [Escherichia coli]HAW8459811.1 type VI secretion system baseplate subunit TssG [Escherichia coli]HCT9508673.1 type VI secretion system baseplate subunit TssG [Escherichia coli]HCU6160288.1 type VI secretion system baseplate subunit TssG [Escherichia coli]HCU6162039.1 type VI secretion system baseplate subunit TssG [Escherichia coli]
MALINNRSKFSFFNKVRVLLKKFLKPDESIDDVIDEYFRFTSSLSLDSPDGQIENLYHDEKDGKYHLSLFHNGLTGAAGVLPVAYTEWLIERKLRYNDDAPKAFMNMFDHRMYCLSYLAWQKMHLSGDENRRDNNVLNNILLSLGGVTPQTISMTGLAYTAFYAQSVRTLSGLEQLLSSIYQIRVSINPFRGTFENTEPNEQGILGNCQYTLGEGPVIGNVRWVVDSHFDVVLGPIDYKKAMEFMPGRDFNYFISQQIKSYVGDALKFKIYVIVYSSNHDNQMNINNKLGFNISIGSGVRNYKERCFCISW